MKTAKTVVAVAAGAAGIKNPATVKKIQTAVVDPKDTVPTSLTFEFLVQLYQFLLAVSTFAVSATAILLISQLITRASAVRADQLSHLYVVNITNDVMLQTEDVERLMLSSIMISIFLMILAGNMMIGWRSITSLRLRKLRIHELLQVLVFLLSLIRSLFLLSLGPIVWVILLFFQALVLRIIVIAISAVNKEEEEEKGKNRDDSDSDSD